MPGFQGAFSYWACFVTALRVAGLLGRGGQGPWVDLGFGKNTLKSQPQILRSAGRTGESASLSLVSCPLLVNLRAQVSGPGLSCQERGPASWLLRCLVRCRVRPESPSASELKSSGEAPPRPPEELCPCLRALPETARQPTQTAGPRLQCLALCPVPSKEAFLTPGNSVSPVHTA